MDKGESNREVAAGLGVSHTTVGRWIEAAKRAETDREKKVARTAMEIAESIKVKEAEAREALLDRLVAKAAECEDNVQQIATAYGILTEGERGGGPAGRHRREVTRRAGRGD